MALRLGMVLGVSALFLGLNSQVVGEESTRDDLDRGENPVVGSLPCKVDRTLNLIFWEGEGLDSPGRAPAFYPVTLGVCSPDVRMDVVDADGIPFGYLNDRWDWRSMGLQQSGYMLISRFRAESGAVTSWVYTPTNYIGGKLSLSSSLTDGEVTLGQYAAEIPISDLVRLAPSGNAVTMFDLKITPPASHPELPDLSFRIIVMAGGVRIEYM